MNNKTTVMIEDACAKVIEQGIRIEQGAWFTWDGNKVVACDPIGAALFVAGAIPAGIDPMKPETLVEPGLMQAACKLLKVDASWLCRFFMGFDRGHHVTIVNVKEKTESKDEISAYAISLYKEFVKK